MGCLNTSSPEFKKLASAAGLSEESTTAAIRQWQNVDPKNRVDQFPSINWIEEYYKKTSGYYNYAKSVGYTKEEITDLHRIWEEQYKEPITGIKDKEEAYGKNDEARRLFFGEAVGLFQASDGTWTVAVKEPVWQDTATPRVALWQGNWSRQDVAAHTDKVFLFGDNTDDRVNTKHVPRATQAVIRGLPNAIGIDTKKDRGTSESSYFTDADFDTFKAQVDDAIRQAVASGKTIVIPEGGIGTDKAQLAQRAPKLFAYLQEKLDALKNDTYKVENVETEQDSTETSQEEPSGVQVQIKKVKGYDVKIDEHGAVEVTMPGLEEVGSIRVFVHDNDYADISTNLTQTDIDTFFGEDVFNEMLAVAIDSVEKRLVVTLPEFVSIPDATHIGLELLDPEEGTYTLTHSSAAIVDLHTEESDSARYDVRTQKNANEADFTIALAEDFTTPGETATRKAAGSKYIAAQIDTSLEDAARNIGSSILDTLRTKGATGVLKLNFAGNTIVNLKGEQSIYDMLVENVVKYLLDNGIEIERIQSGGQTGIDEAAIKAAIRLGIDYKMNVPKWYKMRIKSDNEKGFSDISGKSAFLERFSGVQYGRYFAQKEQVKEIPHVLTVTKLDGGETFNSTKILSIGDIETATRKSMEADLVRMLNDGTLGIGDRIVLSSTMPVDKLIDALSILGKLKGTVVYEVPSFPNVVGSLNYSEEERGVLKRSGKVFVNEDSVIYPTYSVGFSEDELMLQKGTDNLTASGLFRDTELRALAKATIFRLSDVITKLNNNNGFADRLFSGQNVPTDLQGVSSARLLRLSRADMLNPEKGGISFTSLLNYVIKELTFNPQRNTKAANKSFATRDKMQLIYDNFESFIRLGYDALLNLEHLSFTPGFRDSTSEISRALAESDTEIFSAQDEQEIMEVFGSTAEYWQVGFRQVSVYNSLSQQIRTAISKIYQLDADGHIMHNEMGLPLTVDTGEVVAKILSWGQGAFTSNELVQKLRKYLTAEPWLNQLVGETDFGNTGSKTVGLLVNRVGDEFVSKDDQLTTQFFNNFRKYFQTYAVTYRTKTGVETRVINANEYRDKVMKEITALEANSNSTEGPALKIWDRKKKTVSKAFHRLEDLIGQFSEVPSSHSLYGLDAHDELVKYFNDPERKKNADKYQETLDVIREIYSILDFDVPTTEQLKAVFTSHESLDELSKTLVYLVQGINKQVADGKIDLFERKEGNYNYSNYSKLAKMIEPVMLGNVESVSYESGKMHYSYVNPSYLGTLVSQLRGEVENYSQFLENEYGRYTGWFTWSKAFKGLVNPTMFGESEEDASRWMNWWLETLEKDPEARKNFQHIVSLSDNGVTYVDKSDPQFLASVISMYFADKQGKYGYYVVPTMSNKQSEEYIKFLRVKENYEGFITRKLLTNVFVQEVNRIRTVRERFDNLISEEEKIQNLDYGRGERFQFLDFLNEYLDGSQKNTPFGHALQTFVYANRKFGISQVEGYDTEEAYFLAMLPEVIRNGMNKQFEDFIRRVSDAGFLTYATDDEGNISSVSNVFQIEAVIGAGSTALERLREYFWNSTFASINILQLTVGDLALFASTEDVQKRLAELHSPGIKANENARDIADPDKRVADSFERVMYIKDAVVTTDLHTQLGLIHKKIASDPEFLANAGITGKAAQEAYKKKLAAVLKAFEDINSTDGQGFTSPTGNRKKMHVFGTWDMNSERAYRKVLNQDFSQNDSEVVWQPWKPFSYAQVGYKNVGNTNDRSGNPMYMPAFKLGVQHKYSEAVLEAANELAGRVGVKTQLQALYDFMEESHGLVKNAAGKWVGEVHDHGIDTIMFESGVKTGLTGAVDINGLNYEQTIAVLREASRPVLPEEGYNEIRVHHIPWSSYLKQQENPAHFQDSQQQGSQNRILAIVDTPDFKADGTPNTVQVFSEESGKFKYVEMPVQKAKEKYFKALTENVQISADRLMRRMGLGMQNRKFCNIILSRLLKEEMMKDGRYGSDMLWACSVNRNGEFNVPLSDPVQAGRIQQLLNSIIKNTVNKQDILGGPVVAVSSFGLAEDLQVRFRDKNGRILMSRKEWESSKTSHKSYEDYFNENYFAPAYIEAEAPVYDDFLIQDFGIYDSDGNWTGEIDTKKIEETNPKLLYIYGMRLPTEYRYSMVPIKIVRFNNRLFGERLKLSADVVAMSGYDFDIDKEILERYYFKRNVKKEFNKQILRDVYNRGTFTLVDDVEEAYKYLTGDKGTSLTRSQKRELREWFNALPDSSVEYTTSFDANTSDLRYQRNNNILVDMHNAFATAPQNVDQLFSAGNFDAEKKAGYLIAAMDATGRSYADLSKLSIKELKNLAYSGKNIIFPQTQMDFHRQNMVAAKLIGVFAQANVSHGTMSLHTDERGQQDVALYIPKNAGFTFVDAAGGAHGFLGTRYAPIDRMLSYDGVTKISEVLASLVDASVDAVKDPVLNLFNLNMTTVNVAVTLVRLGFDVESVALFLSTPVIRELVERFQAANVSRTTRINDVIVEMQERLKHGAFDEKFEFGKGYFLSMHNVSASDPEHTQDNYQLLELFSRLQRMSDAFRMITSMTRYNSIASAVGPFTAHTIIRKIQDEKFSGTFNANPYISKGQNVVEAARDNPIVRAFHETAYGSHVPARTAQGLEDMLLGENLVQAGPFMQTVLREAWNYFGYLGEREAQAISEFAMSYYMNIGTPIFDLSFENRRRMLENYAAEEWPAVVEKYPDNVFVQSVRRKFNEKTGVFELSLNTRGMVEGNLEDLRRGWEELYNDESEAMQENPGKKNNAAIDLLEWNFFKGGLGFDPRTFTRLAPNAVRMAIPGYYEHLDADSSPAWQDKVQNLLLQYMLNKGRANLGTFTAKELPTFDAAKERGEFTTVYLDGEVEDDASGIGRYVQADGSVVYFYGEIDGKLKTLTFTKVDKLGGYSNEAFEIDPSKEVWEIESVLQPANGSAVQTNDPFVEKDDFLSGLTVISPRSSEEKWTKISNFDRLVGLMGFDSTKMSNYDIAVVIATLSIEGANVNAETQEDVRKYGGSEFFKGLLSQIKDKTITIGQVKKIINDKNLCS